MNIGYVFLIIMAGAAYFVSGIPTPDQMIADFKAAQKFYTSSAYDQAIEKYTEVGKIESRFVDEDNVIVELGGSQYRIQDATLYQCGNSYSKMTEEELKKVRESRKDEDKEKANKLALEYTTKATEYYDKTQEKTNNDELKVLAQKKIVDVWYLIKNYEKVISEGRDLIEKYPKSIYVQDALYNIGWAYYDTKRYDQSIQTFNELVSRFPTGTKSDRSLFQIGESYFDQGKFSEAAPFYQQLVTKMRINEMTELEIQKIQRDKLAGLTDETALDLAAKAALKIGACYSNSGDFVQASASYKRIASLFKYDKNLIYEAYSRLANMFFDKGDFNASIQAYRDAIDEVKDKNLSAKMQVLIAQRYFDGYKGKTFFQNAITEYQNYINSYSDVAFRAGFGLDEAYFSLARSYHELGVELITQNQKDAGLNNIQQAINTYIRLFKDFPATTITERVNFYMALSYQEYGTPEYLKTAIDTFNKVLTDYPESVYKQYIYVKTGRAYKSLKDYNNAIAFYNKMLNEFPNSDQRDTVWFEMARTYTEMNDDRSAVPYYLKVSRVVNKSKDERRLFTTSRLLVSNILISQNVYDQAAEAINYAVEDTSAIEDTHRLAQLYLLRASAYKSMEKFDLSVNDYTNAYNLNDPETKQMAAISRASVYIDQNLFDKAEKELKELMKSDNETIRRDAQMRLAVISARQGKSEQAIQTYLDIYNSTKDQNEKLGYLRNLIQLNAESKNWPGVQKFSNMMINSDDAEGNKPEGQNYFYKEEAYYSLANSYENQEDYHSAINNFLKGLEKFPKSYFSSDMLLRVGVMYLTKLSKEPDALDNAAKYFDRYIKDFPDTPNTENAHYYLGFCYYNARMFSDAAKVFRDFARIYPNSEFTPEAIFYYSDCYYNIGNLDEAVKGFDLVISKYPKHAKAAEAIYTKGWAYLDLGKENESLQTFQVLTDRFPQSEFAPTALFSVADFYYNKQDYENALKAYKQVLKDYPNTDVAKKVPDTIKDLQETVAYLDYEKAFAIFAKAQESKDLNLFSQAAGLFSTIATKNPGTESEIGSYSNMGICYETLGKWDDAVKAYNKVIELFESGAPVSKEAFNFASQHKNYITANYKQ